MTEQERREQAYQHRGEVSDAPAEAIEPKQFTEDDPHGGTEAVLAATLAQYGLPTHAGLTGLLRHLEGNRAMTEGIQKEHIRFLQEQLSATILRGKE